MIFLANRANLDRRTVHTRIHNVFQSRAAKSDSPVETVWYHPSRGNKTEVRATIDAPAFRGEAHPVETAELQVAFDFPASLAFDAYAIQWVEADRDLMVGWHQDETHPERGECHFQIDHAGATVQRTAATYLDAHPLNVLDARLTRLNAVLDALSWQQGTPTVPASAVS